MKRDHRFLKILWFALLIAAATGCIRDNVDIPKPTANSGKVTVKLEIPGYDEAATRGIEDGKGEAVVQTLDMLIFDKATPATLLQHYQPTGVAQSSSGPNYLVTFEADLRLFDGAGSMVLVANASNAVGTVLNESTSKEYIVNWLSYIYDTSASGGRYEWNVAAGNYTPIPMYGDATVPDGLTAGSVISNLRLTRMVARIDIRNLVDAAVFKLEEIYMINYVGGGYISPAFNASTGELLQESDADYPYTRNSDPVIPEDMPKPGVGQNVAMKYLYDQPSGAGPMLAGEIYVFETPAGFVNAPESRAGLILKGKYRGEENYYRVDFTLNKRVANPETGTVYEVGDLMPIYRNHRYVVTVTAAEGVGYRTYNEAVLSKTVLSNLKTDIMTIDMSIPDMNNIVYDGQYYMAVEQRKFDIYWNENRPMNVWVYTNYPGPWSAQVVDPGNTTWIQLNTTGGGSVSQGKFNLDFSLTAAAPPSAGRIAFRAGRLCDTITIERYSMSNMFARSNVVEQESGGVKRLAFATTREENGTIPAYSEGVFFKWGSLIALAPPGEFSPPSTIVYNPSGVALGSIGTGLAGWDKIPYAHPNFGFNVSPSTDDADAFESYNDTGFNESAGIGDVCRYISSKGWVEGRWRMPTFAELETLFDETVNQSVKSGSFVNTTPQLDYTTHRYGTYDPESGWFLGPDVNSATPSAPDATAMPPDMTYYLPAAGMRYPNGDGEVVLVGAYGHYWSSTPYTTYSVNYLFISKYGVSFNDADRSYAFPVRCISDY